MLCGGQNKVYAIKETILYANARMYTYDVPHGESSGFESGAGLSIPWVRLSLLGGDPDNDTFFRYTS